MKQLIDIAKEVNGSTFDTEAIVKSQRRGDSVLTGASPTGIYCEGTILPKPVESFIGDDRVDLTLWQSKGRIKAFVAPKPSYGDNRGNNEVTKSPSNESKAITYIYKIIERISNYGIRSL